MICFREKHAKSYAWVRSASKVSDCTSGDTGCEDRSALATGQALVALFSKAKGSNALFLLGFLSLHVSAFQM